MNVMELRMFYFVGLDNSGFIQCLVSLNIFYFLISTVSGFEQRFYEMFSLA
jgi:hypothetical protein